MRRILTAATLSVILFPIELAHAGARQDAVTVMPNDPAGRKLQEDWGFSDAIVTGDTVFLSGVVAGPREGETDLQIAYGRAFERISKILERAGASWDDVVDITTFHTDIKAQFQAIREVKDRFVKPPFPAWTAIQVVRLGPDNGITEIKVIAKLPKTGVK
jgi:enamine deaminase RidA (YjgF/YER057c/UK114 family)